MLTDLFKNLTMKNSILLCLVLLSLMTITQQIYAAPMPKDQRMINVHSQGSEFVSITFIIIYHRNL